jgi:hypothetical protein
VPPQSRAPAHPQSLPRSARTASAGICPQESSTCRHVPDANCRRQGYQPRLSLSRNGSRYALFVLVQQLPATSMVHNTDGGNIEIFVDRSSQERLKLCVVQLRSCVDACPHHEPRSAFVYCSACIKARRRCTNLPRAIVTVTATHSTTITSVCVELSGAEPAVHKLIQ